MVKQSNLRFLQRPRKNFIVAIAVLLTQISAPALARNGETLWEEVFPNEADNYAQGLALNGGIGVGEKFVGSVGGDTLMSQARTLRAQRDQLLQEYVNRHSTPAELMSLRSQRAELRASIERLEENRSRWLSMSDSERDAHTRVLSDLQRREAELISRAAPLEANARRAAEVYARRIAKNDFSFLTAEERTALRSLASRRLGAYLGAALVYQFSIDGVTRVFVGLSGREAGIFPGINLSVTMAKRVGNILTETSTQTGSSGR